MKILKYLNKFKIKKKEKIFFFMNIVEMKPMKYCFNDNNFIRLSKLLLLIYFFFMCFKFILFDVLKNHDASFCRLKWQTIFFFFQKFYLLIDKWRSIKLKFNFILLLSLLSFSLLSFFHRHIKESYFGFHSYCTRILWWIFHVNIKINHFFNCTFKQTIKMAWSST